MINNTPYHKVADTKGNFELRNIPAGEYDLTITNVGYTETHRHITLKAGQTLQLFLSLNQEGKAMEEVTVFGKADREKETGSRDRERSASNMINVISSQAMVRSPDISAANVLQRMSGVTIQRSNGGDEAYAVIRGMEPRYSNTLLNGIKIASPDNKSRYVQLGIVPSEILSSIEISKSLTPDMEGDATGGTVNMVVKDAPDKTSFKATASIGYSGLFFDEKYVAFSTRDIQDKSPVQRNPPGYQAQPGDFSRSNLTFWSRQALPSTTAGFSFTHRYLHDKLGFVLADNLQNQYYGNISFQATALPLNDTTGQLHPNDANNFKEYTQQLNNGLVAHLDYVINEKNKINLDNFYLYSYLAQTRFDANNILIGTGGTGAGTGQVFNTYTSQTQHLFVENLKLSGQHILSPNFRFDWAGVYSTAGNRQPDVASINTVYLIQNNGVQTGTYFDGISRTWQKNDDKEYSGILNLDYRKRFGSNELQIKAGGLYRYASRNNVQDDYNLIPPATNANGTAASKPLWTGIDNAQWDVFNPSGTTYNPNSYNATETIYDGYGAIRFKALMWEAGGGLRVEHTNDTWNVLQYVAGELINGGQIYQEFLPSGYFKYELANRQYLHFSYYRSITRPNYYELVPTGGSPAVTTGFRTEGNDTLHHSLADNLDIRYEWFPRGDEHLFIGAFYKHIVDPIEIQLTGGTNGGLYVVKPLNSHPATNVGAEMSFTKYWGRFGVTGNYTYTHSTISSDQKTPQAKDVFPTRPMQGQTDHIVNLSLLYKDTKHGSFVQVSYQYQGTTLAETGQYAGADYFQRPMNTLAVSGEKDIRKHFTMFAKANNLLNTPVQQYVQGVLVLKNTYRATYSLGIRYTY
ncbi:TonB-dependent receptor [Puia dinghuensis]|uniref:TonB-dependent receptor n=2 Tax=Puia dinghuensis TaxID=1792502 RepID=A0A8J2XSV0_9BACT|nr:TonB-dependent receptor [Puia dinghuensis]